jgi:hypothetical protein
MDHLEDAIAATQFRLHKLQELKAEKDNLQATHPRTLPAYP